MKNLSSSKAQFSTIDAQNSDGLQLKAGSNSGIFIKHGGVGIGTQNPARSLDIVGDLHVSGEIFQSGNIFGGAPVSSVNSLTGSVSINAGNLDDFNFDGNAILGFDATLNDQAGTAYTLLASDAGKVITCDNASAVTVTVPSGLGAGFNCSVIQKGAGQVSFTASSTTINNRQSHTKIAGQHGVASLVATAADVFVLAGDTAS